jgi:hypothetical protein
MKVKFLALLSIGLVFAVLSAKAQTVSNISVGSDSAVNVTTTQAAGTVVVQQISGPRVGYIVTDVCLPGGTANVGGGAPYSFTGYPCGAGYSTSQIVGSIQMTSGGSVTFQVTQTSASTGPGNPAFIYTPDTYAGQKLFLTFGDPTLPGIGVIPAVGINDSSTNVFCGAVPGSILCGIYGGVVTILAPNYLALSDGMNSFYFSVSSGRVLLGSPNASIGADGSLAVASCAGCALTGTTGSIGGSPLTVGTCASDTATVTGATTSMVATISPVTDPGDGIYWKAYVSATDTVTVKVCAVATLTPSASAYNVRVQ